MSTLIPKFETAIWKMEIMKCEYYLHFHFASALVSMLHSLTVPN